MHAHESPQAGRTTDHSPSLSANGLPRVPFKPLRSAHGSSSSMGTPRAASSCNPAILKGGSMTPTAVSRGLPVAPLTSSNLSTWTQAAAPHSPTCSVSDDMSSVGTGVAYPQSSSKYGGASRLGVAATTTTRPAGPSMLSNKRYTRQMAPSSPEDELRPTSAAPTPGRPGSSLGQHTVSANDLRVKARVTSGSAPRKKIGVVPGAERADVPSLVRPTTPSNGFSQQQRRARSNSRAAPSTSSSIPPVPSRPASRAGNHDYHPSSSRPASRMDDFGPSSLISASSFSSEELTNQLSSLTVGHRLDSNDSIATTLAVPKSESVLVCVRVRPPAVAHTVANVNPAHLEEAWNVDPENKTIQLDDGSGNEYKFDALVTGSGNTNVYEQAAKNLIHSSMNGFDAVIFAYGQTASGKTFTLSGTPANPGIIPQAVSDIFAYIRSHPNKEFLLRASYIEIYNEQLKDLLAPETAGQVKVRQDEKKRFFVSPLREEVVTNEAHVAQLLARGEMNRHTGQTDYNARSSRSHTVFQMVIESRDVDHSGPSNPNRRSMISRPQTPGLSRNVPADDKAVVTSRLSLIDLAGSEKATSQVDRRVEGAFINKSLLTLEKVIAALTEDKTRTHVPYRDSKLTQILQPSLSGEARVAVICTINPSPIAVQESTSTLKFAQRVKKVTLHAERNEVIGDKALIYRYEQTIAEMTAYIAQLEVGQSVPATPRRRSSSDSDDEDLLPAGKAIRANPEAVKAREDRAKLLGYIVNAGNLDDKKNDEAPRPVSPVKPVTAAQLPFLQEQLLDAQDRIGELEELHERQKDEIASLKAELAARPTNASHSAGTGESSPDSALEVLRRRNEELDKQCREYRTILANEDHTTALKSERRLAAREWSDKLLHLQNSLDRSRALQQEALNQLAEERKKSEQLEKTLLKKGLLETKLEGIARRRSNSLDGLALLASESPMLDIRGSYMNLDEIAHSPMVTPLKSRLR